MYLQNRYTDVLCYDHTRVVLARDDNDRESDYINANFVDGYKQKNAFISMQGPLPRTFSDKDQHPLKPFRSLLLLFLRFLE